MPVARNTWQPSLPFRPASAVRRRRRAMRLEVHEHNTRAIGRYEKSGYRLFGRLHRYYDDGADALRFEKPLGTAKSSA